MGGRETAAIASGRVVMPGIVCDKVVDTQHYLLFRKEHVLPTIITTTIIIIIIITTNLVITINIMIIIIIIILLVVSIHVGSFHAFSVWISTETLYSPVVHVLSSAAAYLGPHSAGRRPSYVRSYLQDKGPASADDASTGPNMSGRHAPKFAEGSAGVSSGRLCPMLGDWFAVTYMGKGFAGFWTTLDEFLAILPQR